MQLWLSLGMKLAHIRLDHTTWVNTLFPGIVTAAIVLQAKGMRIHNPTNGAKLRFSGAVGDYTELRC